MGLRPKKCRVGQMRFGITCGCGLKVSGAGTGKISPTHAGWGGFKV